MWAPSTNPGISAMTRAAPPSAKVPPTSHTPEEEVNKKMRKKGEIKGKSRKKRKDGLRMK